MQIFSFFPNSQRVNINFFFLQEENTDWVSSLYKDIKARSRNYKFILLFVWDAVAAQWVTTALVIVTVYTT